MLASREIVSSWRRRLDWVAAPLFSVCAFKLTSWLAPYSSVPPIVAYFVGFSCVVGAALLAARYAPGDGARGSLAVGSGIGLVLVAALTPSDSGSELPAMCVLAGLLMVGTSVGAIIGRRIQDPSHLLFVALVSGVADTLSVMQPGGVSKAIASEPAALALLALPWPWLGSAEIAPFLGVSDVVFASLYIHASLAHGLPLRRTLLALCVAFAFTATLVVSTSQTIPVLPVLGLSVLAAQPRARAASAADLKRGAWVLAALACVIAAVFLRRDH